MVISISTVVSLIPQMITYQYFAKPGRDRLREHYFSNLANDEPEGDFLKQWIRNAPSFPTSNEEYLEMSQRPHKDFFPEPPLLPYDAKGWDRSRLKNMDLEKEQKRMLWPMQLNFGWPH